MKFFSKLAVVAAATAVSFSALAVDLSSVVDNDSAEEMAIAEVAAPGDATADGSVALIAQSGADQIAIILQAEGSNNFAAIVQAADAAAAAIVQLGNTSTAYISQK